jgi:hypothetical protein
MDFRTSKNGRKSALETTIRKFGDRKIGLASNAEKCSCFYLFTNSRNTTLQGVSMCLVLSI